MISWVHAKITWVPKEKGGRESRPPKHFSTPVRFEKYKDEWPNKAWSLVFDFPAAPDDWTIAEVGFLVPEKAPHELLQPGNKFDIVRFDTGRVEASGEIID